VLPCAYAGLGYTTFLTWMAKGKKARRGQFREFRGAVQEANSKAQVKIVALWHQFMATDYRACRDFLARRYPEKWGAPK
jgi:hypothetical protein